jgi:DNA mismatch endonuclease (patch repair protein)
MKPGSWASSPAARRTMQSNQKKNTKPELVLRQALHALGLRYRIHTTPGQTSRCIADVVFPTERVAIFVDGCFWHGCTLHTSPPRTNAEYWGQKIRGNRERDLQTDRVLAEGGWLSIRVWEHEDPAAAAGSIVKLVTQRRATTRSTPRLLQAADV